MKKKFLLTALLALGMTTSLVACNKDPKPSENPTPTEPVVSQYTDAEKLAIRKDEAYKEIESYKNKEDYREEEQNQLQKLIDKYTNKIDEATTVAEVDKLVAEFKEAADALKTAAQLDEEEAAALLAEKEAILAQIQSPIYGAVQPTALLKVAGTSGGKEGGQYYLLNQPYQYWYIQWGANSFEQYNQSQRLAARFINNEEGIACQYGIDSTNYTVTEESTGYTLEQLGLTNPFADVTVDDLVKTEQGFDITFSAEGETRTLGSKVESYLGALSMQGLPDVEYTASIELDENNVVTDVVLTSADVTGWYTDDNSDTINLIWDLMIFQTGEDVTSQELTKADFEAAALANCKTYAQGVVDAYKLEDYRTAEQEQLTALKTTVQAVIDESAVTADILAALNTFTTAADQLLTDAQWTAIEALPGQKTDAKAEIRAYKDLTLYRQAQQDELNALIATADTEIDAATNFDEVTAAVTKFKAEADKVKTDAELTAEEAALNDAKVAAKQEVLDYRADERAALTAGSDQATEIEAIVTAATDAINNATTIDEVNAAVTAFKEAVDDAFCVKVTLDFSTTSIGNNTKADCQANPTLEVLDTVNGVDLGSVGCYKSGSDIGFMMLGGANTEARVYNKSALANTIHKVKIVWGGNPSTAAKLHINFGKVEDSTYNTTGELFNPVKGGSLEFKPATDDCTFFNITLETGGKNGQILQIVLLLNA